MKRAILVTARLKSSRLPRKALLEVQGKTILAHLLDRMKAVRGIDSVIVCTSPLREDDPIASCAEAHDVHLFRSEPEDVILRLTQAAETFAIDTVLNCTADNPFVDPEWMEKLADFHEQGGYDFSRAEGLPFGSFGYALSPDAMKRACFMKAESDTEVWGPYFTETGKFRCGVMKVTDPDVAWPELRITVDTPEDYALIQAIASGIGPGQGAYGLREIVRWCRNHPEAVALNSHVRQKPAKPIRLRADEPSTAKPRAKASELEL